jgi:hypothetical protein
MEPIDGLIEIEHAALLALTGLKAACDGAFDVTAPC